MFRIRASPDLRHVVTRALMRFSHCGSLVLSGGVLGYRTALKPAFAQPLHREAWLPVLFKFAVALCVLPSRVVGRDWYNPFAYVPALRPRFTSG